MKLHSNSFADNTPIPVEYAFCRPDPETHATLGGNLNPHLAWSDVPEGTRSFVILCEDPDVPTQMDDVNQEGREVPADLPRTHFYHWVLVDLAADTREIPEGAYSDGVTPRGKAGPLALDGTRQGLNGFTNFFAHDRDMSGDYFGYDGPCPPWNDAILHRYVFTVYAVDIEEIPVEGKFTGDDVKKAIEGHILGQASITGIYTLNPRLRDE
ncbi:MAG TPA: YbhB/YbcL family Raf kinase inhibitor-like protein [Paenalcaligenes sp.]|nr:YbhB/YbcL family Raf kinase inhibitor-like protein [Paenalcaligenes sp.]